MKNIKIKSIIKNNLSLLIYTPNSTIQDSDFSGLGFKDYKNIDYVDTLDSFVEFKSKTYDYFFIHGFVLRDFDLKVLSKNKITIKTLCVDLLGEGYDIGEELKTRLGEKLKKVKYDIKILIPFNHYDGLEEEYPKLKFFKYTLGGPRIFCSRYNEIMIHGNYFKEDNNITFIENPSNEQIRDKYNNYNNSVVAGLKWNSLPKEKLFTCLIGTPRPHRTILYKHLVDKKLLDLGFITYRPNSDIQTITTENEFGHRMLFYMKLPKSELDESLFESRFALHTPLAKQSYIEVVAESSHNNLPFKTEKCVKPFYNLQFPIIFGHKGIIKDLRDEGFDMFDDIIDHSYDNIVVESTTSLTRNDVILKSNMITNELLKLSKLDIHSIYLKNKDRFLHNQENLYKKTITENNIFKDLGKFIFGNDIEVNEYGLDTIEKLYI